MFQLDERANLLITIVGMIIALIGAIWLFIRLLPVMRDLIIRGFKPFLVLLIGVLIGGTPQALNRLMPEKIRDDAVIRKVPADAAKGTPQIEVLGLTGAKPSEYDVLKTRKDFHVIKWANKDVTDELVEMLKGMEELRELDLNSSQITDKSLPLIASLPKLEALRLLGTKITDEGFRQHILPLKGLKNLELTGTSVKSKTGREWKAAAPDRQLVQ